MSIDPQSFIFPSKLDVPNVLNWPPDGIGPSRSLSETLNAARKCRLSNAAGIAPVGLLLDKSRTCRLVRLHVDSGI